MDIYNYNCAIILEPATLSLLGSSNYCYWENDCTLVVCQGEDGILSPNDPISFLPNRILSKSRNQILISEQTNKIQIENSNKKPKAILSGPHYVFPCIDQMITLDASYSISNVGRSLTFQWELISTEENKQINEQIIEINKNSKESIIQLDSILFKIGLKYKFKVYVKNFIDLIDSSEIEISIVDYPISYANILGPKEIFIDPSVDLLFESEFYYSACSNTNFYPSYHWQVIRVEDGKMLHTRQDFLSSTLYLPGNTFKPNTLFNVTLHIYDGYHWVDTFHLVQTGDGKICAKISKGNFNTFKI